MLPTTILGLCFVPPLEVGILKPSFDIVFSRDALELTLGETIQAAAHRQVSCAEMLILVSQELLRPSNSYAEELTTTEDELVNGRALDSEDTALVSEYAYALKCAFAESFSVGLHDVELKDALLLCTDPAEETTFAALGLSLT